MVKKILTYILIYAIILLLTASTALITFSTTILSRNYLLNMLENEDYFSKTYSSIMEKFKDNTIQSGLEDSVLDGIITKEEIENDIKAFIEYIYTGKEYTISKELVKTRLEENINKVIEENKKKVDSNEQNSINIYVNTIADIYEDGTILSKDYAKDIQSICAKVQNVINNIKIIIYIATIALIILVVIINKANSIRGLSIALIGTGILLIIPKIVEIIALELKNVVIFNQLLSKVVINTVEDVLVKFIIFGIIFIIIGIVGSIFSVKLSKNENSDRKH